MAALRRAVNEELTPRQGQVFITIVLNGAPLDVYRKAGYELSIGWIGVPVESSRKRIPLCAHEMAPGLAIRCPPPTMLATDAEWWGSL